MGVVYEATDRLTKQSIALKQIHIQPQAEEKSDFNRTDHRLAISQEFQTLASLRHPHIISVFDYGFTEDGSPFFTMDLLRDARPISVIPPQQSLEDKIQLLVQILQALVYLHSRGIIHRDIKPSNVLVTHGAVKVLDFGIATTGTHNPEIAGTIAYLAPEVLAGKGASEASDLYAVGVIAYELFAGRHPFATRQLQNTNELMSDILDTPADLTPILDYETRLLKKSDTSFSKDKDEDLRPEEASPSQEQLPAKLHFDMNATLAVTDLPPMEVGPSKSGQQDEYGLSLAGIIGKLLSKDYRERYQDAKQVIEDFGLVLGKPLPIETQATRESFIQAATFVGREKELSRILSALQKTELGNKLLWLVSGESGVGKSRLLQEVRIRALVQGFKVVQGQAQTEGVPYQIWRGPLQQLILEASLTNTDIALLKIILPDIEDILERPLERTPELSPEEAQRQLFAAFSAMLHQRTKPLLILLEDLQWAGSESLSLLSYLREALINQPILMIGSYRDDEAHDLETLFADAEFVKIGRLTSEAIIELSRSMIGAAAIKPQVRDLLQTETEGNVYFLVEVVRALAEEAGGLDLIGSVPLPKHIFTGGLESIIRRRLKRIPQSMVPLLQSAAAFGRELDLTLLKQITSEREINQWLLACADAAVLEIHDNQWRFSYDKLRQQIIATFSSTEKQRIYRQTSEAIEAVYADRENHAAALAYHWGQAGEPAKKLSYTALAGEQAYRVSDNSGAVAYFKQAIALLDLTNTPDAAERQLTLKVLMAKALGRLSQYDKALDLLNECITESRQKKQVAVQAEALLGFGRIGIQQGEYLKATTHLRESLALFRDVQDKRGIADSLISLGQAGLYQGDYEGAAQYLNEGLALFRELGNQAGAAYALSSLGMLKASQNLLAEASGDLQASIALYEAIGNRNGLAGVSMNLGMVSGLRNNYDEAITYYTRSLALFRELGDQSSIAACLNNLGYVMLNQQQYASAQEYFLQSLHITRQLDDQWGTANIFANLGTVALEMQMQQEAKTYFRQALQIAEEIGALPLVLEVMAGFARLQANSGDHAGAVSLLKLILNHPATDAGVLAAAEAFLETLVKQQPNSMDNHQTLSEEESITLERSVKKLLIS